MLLKELVVMIAFLLSLTGIAGSLVVIQRAVGFTQIAAEKVMVEANEID